MGRDAHFHLLSPALLWPHITRLDIWLSLPYICPFVGKDQEAPVCLRTSQRLCFQTQRSFLTALVHPPALPVVPAQAHPCAPVVGNVPEPPWAVPVEGLGRWEGGEQGQGQASGPDRLAVLLICIWCPPFTSHDEALVGAPAGPMSGLLCRLRSMCCPSFPGGPRAVGHGPYPGGSLLSCLTIKARTKLLPCLLTLTLVQ